MVFRDSEKELDTRILSGKLGEYYIINDASYPYLNIDAYLKGQFYNKICVATARNKPTVLNITTQILGGAEYFSNHW